MCGGPEERKLFLLHHTKVRRGMGEVVLDIQDLWVEYRTFEGTARAVNGVWLRLHSSEAAGLVGETGAGETTTALSVLRVLPPRTARITRGRIIFEGRDLLTVPEAAMRGIGGRRIAMISQNPLTSLNPVFTMKQQMCDVLIKHANLTRKEAERRACELLEMVGIAPYRINDYAHQFSGGIDKGWESRLPFRATPPCLSPTSRPRLST